MDKLTIALNLRAREPLSCERPELRPAAVLLPIFPAPEGLSVCFIRRPVDMRHHGGQIAFPGGGAESGDLDLAHTAVRETHEELGIDPGCIEILGRLDETWTPSGYRMTPFVGWLEEFPRLEPDPREVAEILRAPLELLMEPERLRIEYWDRDEVRYRIVFFDIPGGPVWGATARVLYRFLQLTFGWRSEDLEPWETSLRRTTRGSPE